MSFSYSCISGGEVRAPQVEAWLTSSSFKDDVPLICRTRIASQGATITTVFFSLHNGNRHFGHSRLYVTTTTAFISGLPPRLGWKRKSTRRPSCCHSNYDRESMNGNSLSGLEPLDPSEDYLKERDAMQSRWWCGTKSDH